MVCDEVYIHKIAEKLWELTCSLPHIADWSVSTIKVFWFLHILICLFLNRQTFSRDRIISPADSVRAITVGSLALYDSNDIGDLINEEQFEKEEDRHYTQTMNFITWLRSNGFIRGYELQTSPPQFPPALKRFLTTHIRP